MPNERRPGVVQHPLNDARRFILVARVAFEHGALAFVGRKLHLHDVVSEIFYFAIARSKCVIEDRQILEGSASAVERPVFIDWPEMPFRKHRSKTLDGW